MVLPSPSFDGCHGEIAHDGAGFFGVKYQVGQSGIHGSSLFGSMVEVGGG